MFCDSIVLSYICRNNLNFMQRKLLYVALSVVLLSVGWLGAGGFTLLAALVPLLFISQSYTDSKRDWWRMAGWASLTFALWNVATVWWVWIATPIGPIAATIISTFWNMVAFMLYHYVSKRAPKSVAYTLLVAAWIATEFLYIRTEVLSFPWLVLGNGFSGSTWAVQWYEYTGVLGGSLWVLLANIAIFEALQHRTKPSAVRAGVVALLPVVVSLAIFWSYKPEDERVKISVVQPNVDCYAEKFNNTANKQLNNIVDLIEQTPADTKLIVLPETSLPELVDNDEPQDAASVNVLSQLLATKRPDAMIAAGASTIKYYDLGEKPSDTARQSMGSFYDIYNSAVAIGGDGEDIHHKMRLVIGVEAMPWWFQSLSELIDLGGVSGQLGRSDKATVFEKGGITAGPAICYEGLYGDWFARFVREGADVMLVMSNDGWWGNTPGHKRLFDFCRLRAIETRRAVARSANTGVSGFINSRGDVEQRLDWDERGVLSADVELSQRTTAYVTYGDWLGRMGLLLTFLGVMYFTAYRIRRKNHLV